MITPMKERSDFIHPAAPGDGGSFFTRRSAAVPSDQPERKGSIFLRRTVQIGEDVVERETIECARVRATASAILPLSADGSVIAEVVVQPERGRVIHYYEMNDAGDTIDRHTDHGLAGYPYGTDFTCGEFPEDSRTLPATAIEVRGSDGRIALVSRQVREGDGAIETVIELLGATDEDAKLIPTIRLGDRAAGQLAAALLRVAYAPDRALAVS